MLVKVLLSGGHAAAMRVLDQSGVVPAFLDHADLRITRAQFVAAYKAVAAELDDEMHGLWSRPIRSGTLKYLMLSLLDAANLAIALNRFAHFWNLLLDDYHLSFAREAGRIGIVLEPRAPGTRVNLLGHELLLKLVHGVVSWLLGKEVPLESVEFSFARPQHADDYVFLFPGPVGFGHEHSAVWFAVSYGASAFRRSRVDLWPFLRRAPEDWAFTTVNEGLLSTKVRRHLAADDAPTADVADVARALGMSVRTLTRKLEDEGRPFRTIRDDLRRDMAVHLLTQSRASIDSIATLVGFANTAAFSRAFKVWMQRSPTSYRKGRKSVESL
ncbi:AraC family transcriptional regulator [Cupriavidus sp. SK-4]|uniref:AraC family transcriptional regulator n=1 Tax=Cupriavidus sp. SK-4 TaxID=574750 RepID=UPI000451401D|nr:AraC family transcriptional regulator [Cupriavidus sp. SK-4]EYS88289.1 AraC family transcriptional regulator [Cupriavidus sp. SK-4]